MGLHDGLNNHHFAWHLKSFRNGSLVLGLVALDDLGSNSVHVSDTSLGEGLSADDGGSVLALVGHLSDELGSLELLKTVSDALSSGESVVLLVDSSSLSGRVVLSEGVDSDGPSHVELVGNGGSSDVDPVAVIRSKILEAGGLIVGGPLKYQR